MLRLYIVRHGQTDYNLNGYFQGTSDIPLNENGLRQAEEIARTLGDISFTAAYCSPLDRAVVTCGKILKGKLEPVIDERMKELHFGEWEGMHRDEIKRRWPEQFENYYDNIGDFQPPGGESLADGRARAGEFFDELMEMHSEGNILIVGHQFINALLCTHIMGQDIAAAWDYRAMPGDVFEFEMDGENVVYRKLGG